MNKKDNIATANTSPNSNNSLVKNLPKDQSYFTTLKLYSEIATKYKLLNKKQEREMIEKYRHNRPLLNELLIKHNIRIVMHQAKKYTYRTANPADMLMDGYYGLSIAAERFDLDRDIKFNTFATAWVFKYVIAHFYSKSPEIGVNAFSMNKPIADAENSELGSLLSEKDCSSFYLDKITTIDTKRDIVSNSTSSLMAQLLEKMNIGADPFKKAIVDRNMTGGESLAKLSAEYNVKYSDATASKNDIIATLKSMLKDAGIESVADAM